jgi:hypothetical protein
MIFIIFNGTVVYETGFIRWAGLGLLSVLAGLWVRKLCLASTWEAAPIPTRSE